VAFQLRDEALVESVELSAFDQIPDLALKLLEGAAVEVQDVGELSQVRLVLVALTAQQRPVWDAPAGNRRTGRDATKSARACSGSSRSRSQRGMPTR
jgi:hypothetical protein